MMFKEKIGKGLYVITLYHDEKESDSLFTIAKARSSRICAVTGCKIKSKDIFYMKLPYSPKISISVFGMYMLRNRLKPELEDWKAQYIAENLDKLIDFLDQNIL